MTRRKIGHLRMFRLEGKVLRYTVQQGKTGPRAVLHYTVQQEQLEGVADCRRYQGRAGCYTVQRLARWYEQARVLRRVAGRGSANADFRGPEKNQLLSPERTNNRGKTRLGSGETLIVFRSLFADFDVELFVDGQGSPSLPPPQTPRNQGWIR